MYSLFRRNHANTHPKAINIALLTRHATCSQISSRFCNIWLIDLNEIVWLKFYFFRCIYTLPTFFKGHVFISLCIYLSRWISLVITVKYYKYFTFYCLSSISTDVHHRLGPYNWWKRQRAWVSGGRVCDAAQRGAKHCRSHYRKGYSHRPWWRTQWNHPLRHLQGQPGPDVPDQ